MNQYSRIEKYSNAIGSISEGERNGTLHKIGILLRTRFGLTGDDLLSTLSGINRTKCTKPLSEGEVARIAKSVDRSNAAVGECQWGTDTSNVTVRHKSRTVEYKIVHGDTISTAPVLEKRISVYSKCWINTPSGETTIGAALEEFRTGGDARDLIEAVRAVPDKEERKKLKQATLPGMVFASEPQSIRNAAACVANGVFNVDCDGIPKDKLEEFKQTIATLPYVIAVFLSVSGDGLFVLVAYQDMPDLKKLLIALQKDFPCKIDSACSDISRLRFFTLDENPVIKNEVSQAILIECQEPADVADDIATLQTGGTIRNEPFPLDALPGTVRDIIKTIAKAQSVPESFVAYPALSHGAAAIGNSVEVRCYADGGAESAILWNGVLATSGSGKSEVLRKLRYPFEVADREHAIKFQEELDQYQQDIKAGNNGTVPVEKHLLIQDATMASIFVLCSKTPHGLLLSEPEGRLFFSFDRFSSVKTDEANYCKLYDRDFFKINRKNVAPISGIGMLSIAMMIQPSNFRKSLEVNPGMMTSGLLARMNLCYPEIGEFHIAEQVDRSAYHNWFQTIDGIIGRRTDGTPVVVSLDGKAQTTWNRYMIDYRNLARRTKGWLGGYYDRLHVTAIRLALQFHYFEGGGAVMKSSVVERGIIVAEYMRAQNERVAEMFAGGCSGGQTNDHADREAAAILGAIERNGETTKDDLRHLQIFKKATRPSEAIDAKILELRKRGMIESEFVKKPDGGRGKEIYRFPTCGTGTGTLENLDEYKGFGSSTTEYDSENHEGSNSIENGEATLAPSNSDTPENSPRYPIIGMAAPQTDEFRHQVAGKLTAFGQPPVSNATIKESDAVDGGGTGTPKNSDGLGGSISTELANEVADVDQRIFTAKAPDNRFHARGMMSDDGKTFTVLAGSKINPAETNSIRDTARAKRETLQTSEIIKNLTFEQDYVFDSPSIAAGVISGHNVNANIFWDGLKTFKDALDK